MSHIKGTPRQHTVRPPREPRKPGATIASMQAVSRHQREIKVTIKTPPWEMAKEIKPEDTTKAVNDWGY